MSAPAAAALAALCVLVSPLAAQDGKHPMPGGGALGGGMRVTPAEWAAMPTPPGYSFATGVASFTSQYGLDSWYATQALGAPNVFPRYGDLPGAWAPASTSSPQDVLVLTFGGQPTQEIWVFETYGVGGLFEVDDLTGGSPVPLWVGTPAAASAGEARVLRITLPQPRPIFALRLIVSAAAVGLYPEIDAVCIVPSLAGPQLAAPVPAPGASAPKP